MKTWLKITLIVLAAAALVGAGFVVAGLIQSGPQAKTINFNVIVRAPGDYSLNMEPKDPVTGVPQLDVTKGEPAVFTITVSSTGGFDVPVLLDITGLPAGSWSFSVNPVPPNGSAVLTIQTSGLASNTSYNCALTATPK